MTSQSIQQVSPNSGALSAEHYQTFEMAKANDTILGGDDLQQIRSYAAFTRAQAQAMHKTIASMSDVEDVMASKAEMTETAQTFAKVSVYADQRIGEILRELPKAKAGRKANSSDATDELTKDKAIKESGIERSMAYDLQAMAANPEVVEAVIAKAEQDGRVVSRSQVLKAIKERDEIQQRLAESYGKNLELGSQIASLKRQVAEQPEPEVIEREVEVVREVESQESKRRIAELERLERLHNEDYQRLRKRNEEMRKELDKAKDILGMDKTMQDVRRDVQYLITSTNQYVRRYGGLTWTAESLTDVDDSTIEELRKSVRNLATFANTLMNFLEEINGND